MQAQVTVELLKVGQCTHPEHVVLRGGAWKSRVFPNFCFLIRHSVHGLFLFDTGYSPRFLEAASEFPLSLYPKFTPMNLPAAELLQGQLAARGIDPKEIGTVIISHFHGDHVAGLRDFPAAKFICYRSAYESQKNNRGFKALLNGYLPGLIPEDFSDRMISIDDRDKVTPSDFSPFSDLIDLFGDGSIMAVQLNGHHEGQMGLFIRSANKGNLFLCADACWISETYQKNRLPAPIVHLITSNWNEYKNTIARLHDYHRSHTDVLIIPSHCTEAAQRFDAL